jgi:hypothetical protein
VTRINIGIPVKELHYKHLIAEHREIKRIPNLAKKRKSFDDIPKTFTMGNGHVKFFYDKLGYLKDRYEQLYNECINRGYNVTYFGDSWNDVPKNLMNDWSPTPLEIALIRIRIAERTPKK